MSTIHTSPANGSGSARPDRGHAGSARWAVGIAGAVVAVLVVAYSIFGLTWALEGEDAVSDTFVGYLAGSALIGGMLAALVAFVMAVVARVKRQRSAPLWLPTALFPALVVIVTLVETLWME